MRFQCGFDRVNLHRLTSRNSLEPYPRVSSMLKHLKPAMKQGLTLVHFLAQTERFL